MNIAINTRLLLHNKMEGIGRYTYETTKRIVALNPQHHFYFLFDRKFHEDFIFADNVTGIVVYPPTRLPILIHWWFEKRLPKIFKKLNIDLFLSGDNMMSLKTDVPTFMVSHDLAFHHFPEHLPKRMANFYNTYSPQFHKKAKQIIAVSEATKNDIVNTYSIEPEKIKVAYNDAPKGFEPITQIESKKIKEEITSGQDYFVYVGAIHPRKNSLGLLKAFELFKNQYNSKHKLVLVGRKAWNNQTLESYFSNMKHRSQVVFLNHVPDLTKIMASATALIYPSLFEGFGIPILEAFHAEIPVITSNLSSMPEVAGDAAILINPNDPQEISEAMDKISSDDGLRASLIEKGKIQRQKFNWDKSAKIISEIMNDLS